MLLQPKFLAKFKIFIPEAPPPATIMASDGFIPDEWLNF